MARKPDLVFSHQFKHNIWKVHAVESSSTMVIEMRDQERLKVSFSIFDIKSLQLVTTGIELEESWWVSVAQISEGEVIFYTFDADNNPKVKQYIGYHIANQKITWIREHLKSSKLEESSVVSENNTIEIPFHYQSGSEYFNTVQSFISSKFNNKIVRAVDYMEREAQVLISYFMGSEDKLVNKLLVIDTEGHTLLEESLGIFNSGISDNTFFIFNNTLIFVKGLRDLFMYDLNK